MSRLWVPPPTPASPLARYRALSPTCGIHVSPLQLGAMSIGDKWESLGMGAMNKESSFALLDAYWDMGGNFIDTANAYQDESSEEIIGEWMEARGNRDQLVVATKYSICYKYRDPAFAAPQKIAFNGNNAKSMHLSLEASLKKLRTTYVDILYVHWWDWETPVEEVMNALHALVMARKVLYLGISDTPAWVVAQANQYARDHAKTPFVIYQGNWNVMQRSFEREILPMCRTLGLALAPFNVLAGGKLRTDAEEAQRKASGEAGRMLSNPNWERTDAERTMSAALEKVAAEVGTHSVTAVAIAYLLHKTPYVFPIVGGRKIEHLKQNVEALNISLSPAQMAHLESVLPFDIGFPASMIGDGTGASYPKFIASVAHIDRWPQAEAIRPQ